MNKISKLIYSNYVKFAVLTTLIFSFTFSRSFLGLYLFGYRIGEYLMAFAMILFILTVFFKFNENPLNYLKPNLRTTFVVLFLFFIFTFINSGSQITNPYSFKTSSYIWSFSFIFIGMNSKKLKLDKLQINILQIIVFLVYLTSIFGYPQQIANLVLQFSDKYELHKGSDLALFFIISILVMNRNLSYDYEGLKYFSFNSSLFLPLLLYKSRSAFIGCLLVFTLEVYKYFKNSNFQRKQIFNILIISFAFLTLSTFLTMNRDIPEEINIDLIVESYESLSEYRLKHYQQDYPILYFENGRVLSGDGNLNWRLIMWQDSIQDNIDENKLLFGTGYKDKFNVFKVNNTGFGNDRRGLDQLNEQVHNYFVTVLLRGGIIQLLIVMFIFYNILTSSLIKDDKVSLIVFTLSVLFISSFDSSMENSHFPLLFFYFIGNFYLTKKTS